MRNNDALQITPMLRFPGFNSAWETKRLKELGTLIRGLTYSPNDIRTTGLLVLRSSNVQEGKITYNDNVYVDTEIKGANIAKVGDIIICVRNGSENLIGKNAMVTNSLPKSTHGAFMLAIRALNPMFTFQLLQTQNYKRQVYIDLGARINSINTNQLDNYKFSVPAQDEQQKIASFLSSVDEWINNLKEQKELLQQYKKGMMQKIFSQEIRFKDENGNEFPEWEEKKLADIAIRIWIGLVTTMTSNYSIEGNRLIRNSNIRDNRIEDDKPIYLDNVFAEKYRDRCLRLDDLVTVHTGDVGTTAIIDQEFDGAHGFATLNTRLDNRIAENSYVAYFLNSYKYKNWALRFSTGDGRNNLNLNDFIKSVIPLPVFSEQQKISSFLSLIDAMIGEKVEQLNQAAVWKKGLMQRLFI